MIRDINLERKFAVKTYEDKSTHIQVTITKKDLSDFILGLQLILFEKIKSLHLPAQNEELVFTMAATQKSTYSADKGHRRVSLTENDVGAITSYLLEYYHNGLAPANHIDIELKEESGNYGVSLTILAYDSVEPMSGEEAMRILSDK